eukprot:74886-Pelagomonas_calceolata.AAC.1
MEAILLHHFVPDDLLNGLLDPVDTVHTALETVLGVDNSTLKIVRNADNGVEILHRHPLTDSSTINATVVEVDIKMITISGYYDTSGVPDSEERGVVHIIDMVMLPIPED